jgi:hypothetical protein
MASSIDDIIVQTLKEPKQVLDKTRGDEEQDKMISQEKLLVAGGRSYGS